MPLSEKQRAVAEASAFLAGLDPAVRGGVLARARSGTYPAGTILLNQGEHASRLLLLVEGAVKISTVTASGSPVTIRHLAPGELAGCVGVFCGVRLPASAITTERSKLIYWTGASIAALLLEYPELKTNALAIVGSRAAEMMRRVEELSTENAERRIARALLRLANSSDIKPTAHVSRQDLAELTATTLHTVSRTVSEWQRRGWVRAGRQRIAVIAPEMLLGEVPKDGK